MPKDEDYKFWIVIALIAAVLVLAIGILNRLLPDNRSIECLKVGGTWQQMDDGYCERVKP